MSDVVTVGLKEVIKSVRQEWREKLSVATRLGEHTKLGKKAGVLLLDLDILEDKIAEVGGEEELVFVICAQIAGGTTLTQWCEHYALQRGLVWAFLTETEERFERYQRALRGVADEYVAATIKIADDGENDTYEDGDGNLKVNTDVLQRSKLRVDTRLKVAGYYDKPRFGNDKGSTGVAVAANITIIHESS